MTDKPEKIDCASIQQKALEQFRSGKSLLGKDGAFAPLFKQFLEAALEAELETHIKESEEPNRRNGQTSKTVKSTDGQFELTTSRDRNGTFEPQIIKKREMVLADNLQDRIIGMYGLGMSLPRVPVKAGIHVLFFVLVLIVPIWIFL